MSHDALHATSHQSGGADDITALVGAGATSAYTDHIEYSPWAPSFSRVNFASFAISTAQWNNGSRAAANQNDEVVFAPRYFRAGTWTLVVMQTTGTNRGIATVSMSTDASAWTDVTTVDGYAASGAATRSEVTGLILAAAGAYYVRIKMATKNASSSGYAFNYEGMYWARTGA